ncbi:hypothetical protein DL770_010413 [Monosporascus sp. CRB-9-2]|nr:hypothetical protein DL770_010413 [Monosporascus sp. CRB-9-2]
MTVMVFGSSQPAAPASASAPAVVPAPPVGGAGPRCGKGYTYCGYMLKCNGHNVNRADCDGLAELCANNRPETDIGQTVFICMEDQPSTIKLMCAHCNRLMNDAASNFIAHYDKSCANSYVSA